LAQVDDPLLQRSVNVRVRWSVPELLYHYTDSAGLQGILESRTLWATDIRYLNDETEASLRKRRVDGAGTSPRPVDPKERRGEERSEVFTFGGDLALLIEFSTRLAA